MIKLGVNSVLFKTLPFSEAARLTALCGYDGLEIAAIQGMCEHLDLDVWERQKDELLAIMGDNNLAFLATEVASLDPGRLLPAFAACQALGIPVVNVGPGGKQDDQASLDATVDRLAEMAAVAAAHGVTLCVKAHVGAAIHDTATTLYVIEQLRGVEGFGIDMDPSHIYRAGERPEEALPPVLPATRHIHIRDCKGPGPSPGIPQLQTCGRGDINLDAYLKAMVAGGYDGPVNLEVIGPELTAEEAVAIAAESYGYMNAILGRLQAR
ncbi:MAG: sugar phosphate isomerase/epimerase [Bacillota bacterium]|nr:sugar phosphate isomerase/epimerase [Bacillota bacterium]